jgi:hypothetical protein
MTASRLGWALLALLLTALVVTAAATDRKAWPGLVGDEATYLMQAESLAWDLDLRYSRADYDRFVAHWGKAPDGLILQSGDGGKTLTYGKPLFYSLAIAPLVRLSPTRGAPLTNALLLALAAVAAALALGRRVGEAAPLWLAVFVFASVAFGHVFWAHSDLFLMDLVALAFALAYAGAPPRGGQLPDLYSDALTEEGWRFTARWAGAGALLAVVALSRPFYAGLLAAAALAVPVRRRRPGLAALAGGVALAALAALAVNLAVHGSWTSYGGERLGFYSTTGFPEVDFPASTWGQQVAGRETSGSWVASGQLLPYGFKPRVWAWDAYYFLAGRHVGVLPYFLPLLLGLLAFRGTADRWALLAAVLLAVACFFYVRPFNFYGGGAALANRYFLPLYPAFWFLAARPLGRLILLAPAVLAGPLLWPLWTAPGAYPYDADGGYRYVSTLARRLLPYETTQSHLKPAGVDDVVHNGMWVKPLTPDVRPEGGGAWFALRAGATAELLLGRAKPLAEVHVEFAATGPTKIEVGGGRLGDAYFHPDGRTGFQVLLPSPTARHPMWWTDDDVYLYRLLITPKAASAAAAREQRFRILPQ